MVAIQKFECYLRAIISLLLHVAFITGSQRPVAPDPCGNILKSFFIEIVKVSLLCSHIGKYGAMCPQHLLTEAGGIRLFIEEHATIRFLLSLLSLEQPPKVKFAQRKI